MIAINLSSNLRPATLVAGMLALGLPLSGCGGAEASFGSNFRVDVVIGCRHIENIGVTVSPMKGKVTDPRACNETRRGFGCTSSLDPESTTIEFTTNSDASESPYYVYVTNHATTTQRVSIDVFMNDDPKVGGGIEVFAGETLNLASVFRQNARLSDLFTSRGAVSAK